jgi:hypothetical protein
MADKILFLVAGGAIAYILHSVQQLNTLIPAAAPMIKASNQS